MKDPAAQGEDSALVERRLATILMADVFGYSRMMGEDEERTVRTFRGHRAVFDELLKAHRGRIFNTAGDAILAEFPSAVEAVRCATEIQAALRTRNEHLPEAERMWFRIGINLGDVIVQGGDLLGDGVNVAARIQTVADPGGVCISGSVYDQIQNKLTLQFRQLGERSFKNIAQPVRTFSIADESGSSTGWSRPRRRFPAAAVAAALALLVLLGGGAYWLHRDYDLRAAEEGRRAEEMQRSADALRKSEQDKAAAAADKEAKLQAELQSAKSALALAEAGKRKAEVDRAATEVAQREAKLQADLKAAKDASQKASDNEKRAEQERLAAAAAARSAESDARKGDAKERQIAARPAAQQGDSNVAAARRADAAKGGAAGSAKGLGRFDGTYVGRMCSTNTDGSPRCWPVALTVEHGTLSASWTNRNNLPSHATGTIAADGSVKLSLDGYSTKGRPMIADVQGSVADNKITVTGAWSNGAPLNATWVLNR